MGWLDKLKAIFHIELKEPIIKIDFSKRITNNTYVIQGSTLTINPDKLTPEEAKGIKEVFKELPPGKRILNEETQELLQKLYKYKEEMNADDAKTIEFFSAIIPEGDLEALRYSLYLRQRFRKKEDVSKLKEDIREKFGQRGNTISNLCTAGYFEEFLIPLYQGAGLEEFSKLYEAIVTNRVLTAFVHQGMSDSDLKREIEGKIETSRKYGLKFVHIHGIGKANSDKIKKLFDEEKNFFTSHGVLGKKILEKESILVIELII